MGDIKDQIQSINADYQTALKANDNASYSKLSINIADTEAGVREYIQDITKKEMALIVNKLRRGEALNKFETDYIRLWLVSDAESYIAEENDLDNWKNESKRLVEEIAKFQKPGLNFAEAAQLRALLLDLMRNTSDINFYLQQKERVEKFNESIKDIDAEERELLIGLLSSKMRSSDY
jgi:hypothetical protein